MPREVMIGIADLDAQYCIPQYQTFRVKPDTIRDLAKALATHQLKYRNFVFMTFLPNTQWTVADRQMQILWNKYAS